MALSLTEKHRSDRGHSQNGIDNAWSAWSAQSEDRSETLLAGIGTMMCHARHQTIFNEGDEARFRYRVLEGGVGLAKIRSNGRRQIVEFLLPGDFFGFDKGEERGNTAEALCETVVARYPHLHIDRLCDQHAAVRRIVRDSLHRQLSTTHEQMLMVGRETAKERTASLLLCLARRQHVGERDKLRLPMGRADIADYLGLTVETVCRSLTEMTRSGLIDIPDRSHIRIRHWAGLELAACRDDE